LHYPLVAAASRRLRLEGGSQRAERLGIALQAYARR
jgi:hypothetical protein